MGASESTAKTNNNATGDDQENKRQQQSSAGTSIGEAVAIAAAGVAAVGATAWTISKALSELNSANSHQTNNNTSNHGMETLLANSRQTILQGSSFGKRSVWSAPPIGRFKLNTDGGCHSIHGRPYESPEDVPDDCRVERRPSGYGGILRDHRGKWVRGFRGYIGVTDCFTAELHGIHKGLELLEKLGYYGAILESDCLFVVKWINNINSTASKSKIVSDSWSIIVACRRLARNNNIEIVHVKGDDANICAHKLADLAIDKEDKHVEIEDLSQLPNDIKRLVDKDAQTIIGYPSISYAY